MGKSNNQLAGGAFVLNEEHTFDWTIYVDVPINSKFTKTKFTATFKHLGAERRQEILDEYLDASRERREKHLFGRDDDTEMTEEEANLEAEKGLLTMEHGVLKEVLVGFRGIKTPSADDPEKLVELAYNAETKARLLNHDWARRALFKAFMKSLEGRNDRKN